ncbi:hypothetical protein [Dysgonomonas sp. 37-18]|nr:hypothetical protein [Dysgonomonas sp. 37-18]
MASGSTGGGSGSRIRRSTSASRRSPSYQSSNSGGANYVPF